METTARSTWQTPADVACAFGLPAPASETIVFAERADFGAHGASARVLLTADGRLCAVALWQAPGASLTGQWHPTPVSLHDLRRDWLQDPERRAVLEPLLASWRQASRVTVPDPDPDPPVRWHVSPVPDAPGPQAFAWRGPDHPVLPQEVLLARRQTGQPRLWNGATTADACFRAVEALAAAGYVDVAIVPCPRAARALGMRTASSHPVPLPTAVL